MPEFVWGKTDPTWKPHAALIPAEDTTATGLHIPVVPTIIGGVVVLGIVLGVALGSGGGSSPTTPAANKHLASQPVTPEVSASTGSSGIQSGSICVTSQPPPSQGPTSQGPTSQSPSQGPSTPGATGQTAGAYVEIKVVTDPSVTGPWVMRLTSVGSNGVTNINATSAVITAGTGTFTIHVPQLGITFQTISFVNPQTQQMIQMGPFTNHLPFTVQSVNGPCTSVP